MRFKLAEEVVSEEAALQIGQIRPAIAEPLIVAVSRSIWIEQKQGKHIVWVVEL